MMGKPWSKLQKRYYLLVADELDIQLQCRAYRMDSQWGTTNLPRYWITLGKEILWDYPKDFIGRSSNQIQTDLYPYVTDVSRISHLIRDYVDTPRNVLLNKNFDDDYWGLTEILKASDKRIGQRRLPELRRQVTSTAALKVIDARLRMVEAVVNNSN
ncbi:MAG: hypothetical protein AAGA67_00175 [Cyanobacteria bacterium P01_F01_bin.153]